MVQIPVSVKNFVRRLKKTIRPTSVLLFGSRATGRAGPDSDYDILIVSDTFRSVSPHIRATNVYKFHDGSFPLEVVCLTPAEFKSFKHKPTIVREAVKQAVPIAIT